MAFAALVALVCISIIEAALGLDFSTQPVFTYPAGAFQVQAAASPANWATKYSTFQGGRIVETIASSTGTLGGGGLYGADLASIDDASNVVYGSTLVGSGGNFVRKAARFVGGGYIPLNLPSAYGIPSPITMEAGHISGPVGTRTKITVFGVDGRVAADWSVGSFSAQWSIDFIPADGSRGSLTIGQGVTTRGLYRGLRINSRGAVTTLIPPDSHAGQMTLVNDVNATTLTIVGSVRRSFEVPPTAAFWRSGAKGTLIPNGSGLDAIGVDDSNRAALSGGGRAAFADLNARVTKAVTVRGATGIELTDIAANGAALGIVSFGQTKVLYRFQVR